MQGALQILGVWVGGFVWTGSEGGCFDYIYMYVDVVPDRHAGKPDSDVMHDSIITTIVDTGIVKDD